MSEEKLDELFSIACDCSSIQEQEIKNYIKDLQNQLQQKENIIKEVREYLTSFQSIETIQQTEHPEKNKGLDEKTFIEIVNRYMEVHHKLLEILDKDNNEKI